MPIQRQCCHPLDMCVISEVYSEMTEGRFYTVTVWLECCQCGDRIKMVRSF